MKHTFSISLTSPSEQLSGAVSVEAEFNNAFNVAMPDASPVSFPIEAPLARLKSLFLISDINCIITFHNSGLDEVFNLSAGVPVFWCVGNGLNCFLTRDVTSAETQSDGNVGTLKLRALIDSTP